MLQRVWHEQGTHPHPKPICTKSDGKQCFRSVKRVEAQAKKAYMETQQVRGLVSTAGSMAKTLNSADLHSDGVIDGSRSKHSY